MQGGQSATPDSKKFAKNREGEGKNQEKSRKKKRKNQDEKAKIEKVLTLCPSWQTGLATLLRATHQFSVAGLWSQNLGVRNKRKRHKDGKESWKTEKKTESNWNKFAAIA